MYNDFKRANIKLRASKTCRHKPCAVVSPQKPESLKRNTHLSSSQFIISAEETVSNSRFRTSNTNSWPPTEIYNDVYLFPRGLGTNYCHGRFRPRSRSTANPTAILPNSETPLLDTDPMSREDTQASARELLFLLKSGEKLEEFLKIVAPNILNDGLCAQLRGKFKKHLPHTRLKDHLKNVNNKKVGIKKHHVGSCSRKEHSGITSDLTDAHPFPEKEKQNAVRKNGGFDNTGDLIKWPKNNSSGSNAKEKYEYNTLVEDQLKMAQKQKYSTDSNPKQSTCGKDHFHTLKSEIKNSDGISWSHVKDGSESPLLFSSTEAGILNKTRPSKTNCQLDEHETPEADFSQVNTVAKGRVIDGFLDNDMNNAQMNCLDCSEDAFNLNNFSIDEIMAMDLTNDFLSFEEEFESEWMTQKKDVNEENAHCRHSFSQCERPNKCKDLFNQSEGLNKRKEIQPLSENIDNMSFTYTLPLSETRASMLTCADGTEKMSKEKGPHNAQSMMDFCPVLWNDNPNSGVAPDDIVTSFIKPPSSEQSTHDRLMRITYKTEPSRVSTSTASTFVISPALGTIGTCGPTLSRKPLDFNLNAVHTKCATLDNRAAGDTTPDKVVTKEGLQLGLKASVDDTRPGAHHHLEDHSHEEVGEKREAVLRRNTTVLDATSHLASVICQEWFPEDTMKTGAVAMCLLFLAVTSGTGILFVADGYISSWIILFLNVLIGLGSLTVLFLIYYAKQDPYVGLQPNRLQQRNFSTKFATKQMHSKENDTEMKLINTGLLEDLGKCHEIRGIDAGNQACPSLNKVNSENIPRNPLCLCHSNLETKTESISTIGNDTQMFKTISDTQWLNDFGDMNNSVTMQNTKYVDNPEETTSHDHCNDNYTTAAFKTIGELPLPDGSVAQEVLEETGNRTFQDQANARQENVCDGDDGNDAKDYSLGDFDDSCNKNIFDRFDCSDFEIENVVFPTFAQASTMTCGMEMESRPTETSCTQTDTTPRECESSATQTDCVCNNKNDDFLEDGDQVVEMVSRDLSETTDVSVQADIDALKIYMQTEKLKKKHQSALHRMQKKFLSVRRRCQKEAFALKQTDKKKNEFLSKLQLSLPGLQEEKKSLLAERAAIEKQFEEEKKKNRELVGRLTRLNQQFSKLGQQQQTGPSSQWKQQIHTQQNQAQTQPSQHLVNSCTTTPTNNPFCDDNMGSQSNRQLQIQHVQRNAPTVSQAGAIFHQNSQKVQQQSTLLQNQAKTIKSQHQVLPTQRPQQIRQHDQDHIIMQQQQQQQQHQQQQQQQQQNTHNHQQQQILLLQQQKILQQQRLPIFQLFNRPLTTSFADGHPGEIQQQKQQQHQQQQTQQSQQQMTLQHHM